MFADRVDAGGRLAAALTGVVPHAVVLGLPRGGVVVAAEVAAALDAPLDVIVVRKLRAPGRPELAIGAVGEDGSRVLEDAIVGQLDVDAEQLAAIERAERAALVERADRLRGVRSRVDLSGRTAVVVDDGMATGASARVACIVARHAGAARVMLAVPVAPAATVRALLRTGEVDDVVALEQPDRFRAVGAHYRDFGEVSEDRVAALLRASS